MFMVQRQLSLAAILSCRASCHAMCVQVELTANQQRSKHKMGGPVLSRGSCCHIWQHRLEGCAKNLDRQS